ncbi:hypothetical protein AVEN_103629-1 [Araneus ventricosus]|uniref:Uncharacterized protein n=1 Tax=Araneus ventricosus TaxID=182803 RepID=A0A4Y2HBG6_ARAVE|nr:hypothetical protein AVEN_103629-1 [Araneus ventricosus]
MEDKTDSAFCAMEEDTTGWRNVVPSTQSSRQRFLLYRRLVFWASKTNQQVKGEREVVFHVNETPLERPHLKDQFSLEQRVETFHCSIFWTFSDDFESSGVTIGGQVGVYMPGTPFLEGAMESKHYYVNVTI